MERNVVMIALLGLIALLFINFVSADLLCDCEKMFAPIRLPAKENDTSCEQWAFIPSTSNGTLLVNLTELNHNLTWTRNDTRNSTHQQHNNSSSIPSSTNNTNNNSNSSTLQQLKDGNATQVNLIDKMLNGKTGKEAQAGVATDKGVDPGMIAGIVIGSIVGLVILVIITLLIIGIIIFKSKYKTAYYFVHDVSGKKSFADETADIMRETEEEFTNQFSERNDDESDTYSDRGIDLGESSDDGISEIVDFSNDKFEY